MDRYSQAGLGIFEENHYIMIFKKEPWLIINELIFDFTIFRRTLKLSIASLQSAWKMNGISLNVYDRPRYIDLTLLYGIVYKITHLDKRI